MSLPSKPSGFDAYGQTIGVYIFSSYYGSSLSSSYLEHTCGSWSYNSTPWNSTCGFDKTELSSGTYYARYYLEDNQGRSDWSSAKSFNVSAPALPSLNAPSSVSIGSGSITVSMPSKPSGFDNYGLTIGVYIFSNSSATGTSSSYMEHICGTPWSYNSAPWGASCIFAESELTPGTYYARYYLTDNQGRSDWSAAKSFTVSAPALPSLSAPSTVIVGSSTISVPLPSKPSGFDSYGQTMGVYIFNNSSATGTSSSYMKQTCGSWSYNSAPWGNNCSFNKTNLNTGTYYARYYLTDNQNRSDWSSPRSFDVIAPAPPTLPAPTLISRTWNSVTLRFPSLPSDYPSSLLQQANFRIYPCSEGTIDSWPPGCHTSFTNQYMGGTGWPFGQTWTLGGAGLNSNTTYYARVAITNENGVHTESEATPFTTPTIASSTPSEVPLSLYRGDDGYGTSWIGHGYPKVSLSWNPPSTTGCSVGSPCLIYLIEQSDDGGNTWTPNSQFPTTSATQVTLDFQTGWAWGGVTRRFRVAAKNDTGLTGPWSDHQWATTPAGPNSPYVPPD